MRRRPPISTLSPYTTLFRSNLGRKALTFSDSRQNAARLAGDLTYSHYRDLFRQVMLAVLESSDEGEVPVSARSEEHTSELQSRPHLVCRLLLEKKKTKQFDI